MKSSCSARGLSLSQNLPEIALILSVSLSPPTHSLSVSRFIHLDPPTHTPTLFSHHPIDLHSVVSFSLARSFHVLCRFYLCSLFPARLFAISMSLLNWSVITTISVNILFSWCLNFWLWWCTVLLLSSFLLLLLVFVCLPLLHAIILSCFFSF